MPLIRFRATGVAPDELIFRDKPDGAVKGRLPEGTVVEELSESGKWWQVRTPGRVRRLGTGAIPNSGLRVACRAETEDWSALINKGDSLSHSSELELRIHGIFAHSALDLIGRPERGKGTRSLYRSH